MKKPKSLDESRFQFTDLQNVAQHRLSFINVLWHHRKRKCLTYLYAFSSQICTMLKKKAFEDAGIPVRPVSSSVPGHMVKQALQLPAQVSPMKVVSGRSVLGKNAEVQTFTDLSNLLAHSFFLLVILCCCVVLVKFEVLYRV